MAARWKSFPASEDGGHDAGGATAVHDGKNPERLFVRGVGNEVIIHAYESQGPGCKVGAAVALIGEED